jgi:hypothetical protein
MRVRVAAWLLVMGCPAEEPVPDEPDEVLAEPFPRCAEVDPLRQPYFGDTHVHTTLSLDANLQGTRLRPADAYAFARGAEVELQPYDAEGRGARTLQLDRPLDWVVVSDHAEFLGTVALCSDPGSAAYDDPGCVSFRDNPAFAFITINGATAAQPGSAVYPPLCGDEGADCIAAGMDVWAEVRQAAEDAYDRTDSCTFTSFVGYEWSAGPDAQNLHRNVIFRNDSVPDIPLGYFDAPRVEDLWSQLETTCLDAPPCDVLSIPHNSNLSAGLMFSTLEDEVDVSGHRVWEPLIEIYQHKGDSECLPGTLASDEECGFEKLPYDRLSGTNLDIEGEPSPRDFVRQVLGEGLRIGQATGVDPYLFGFIASTDTHIATPGATSERFYPGHGGAGQNNRDELPAGLPDLVTLSPGGLAVLWAEENSREALFRAMSRREAYGTSGPRMIVRTFAGGDLPTDLCDDDFDARGDAAGVPMGGVIEQAPSGPFRLAVRALADAGTTDDPGAGLQRIQVVKGWLDGDDLRFETFDVAGDTADDLDLDTCAPPTAGVGELCTVWEDPDFDAEAPAFWYVRVLEVPTCRWSRIQCLEAGITCPTDDPDFGACCDTRVEQTLQERAWTSPVWFRPDG